jgi:hypothetical protein
MPDSGQQPITRAELEAFEARLLLRIEEVVREATLLSDPEVLSEFGRQALGEALYDDSPAVPHTEVLRAFGL